MLAGILCIVRMRLWSVCIPWAREIDWTWRLGYIIIYLDVNIDETYTYNVSDSKNPFDRGNNDRERGSQTKYSHRILRIAVCSRSADVIYFSNKYIVSKRSRKY